MRKITVFSVDADAKPIEAVFSFETEATEDERIQAEVMGMIEKRIGKVVSAYGEYLINAIPTTPYFRVGSSMKWFVVPRVEFHEPSYIWVQFDIESK